MRRATPTERAYFERIERANRSLDDDVIPASLDEMFDRLEQIRERLGPWATPGMTGDEDGDLDSHLQFLKRQRAILRRGTART